MNLDALFGMFEEARRLSGHDDFVVIGSLSILGLAEHFDIPEGMTLSIDVDCYTKNDPERIFDVLPALGEHSAYHHRHGLYLDAVAPGLPSLPEGWQERLLKVERGAVRIWFLDPNDAALSKSARGEPRDGRWIRAGIVAGVVSLPILKSRFGTTNFLDDDERRTAQSMLDEDQAWFDSRKNARGGKKTRRASGPSSDVRHE